MFFFSLKKYSEQSVVFATLFVGSRSGGQTKIRLHFNVKKSPGRGERKRQQTPASSQCAVDPPENASIRARCMLADVVSDNPLLKLAV